MGLFGRKKNENKPSAERSEKDTALRDDISKAYDEITSGGGENSSNERTEPEKTVPDGAFEAELFKAKIREFKEKKTQESLLDLMKMLPGRQFFLPSVSNMKEPFEKDGNQVKLKQGAVINPALLTSNDKKTFLPVFTDEKSMTQKSPSGIILKYPFEQCVGIVYNKKNPITGIVINPFTENFIIGEELLNSAFKKIEKTDDSKE